MRAMASCFLNAVCPFNVVPEGNDNEGKPRMGKWYAFLQSKERFGGKLIGEWQTVHMGKLINVVGVSYS